VPDRFAEVVAEAVRHGKPIVEESQVELAAFQRASNLLIVFAREPVRLRRRMAPCGGIIRTILGLQKADQLHLPVHE
jgi:hypothetical protein